MTSESDSPDHIGDPGRVLAATDMDDAEKVALLERWRDALRDQAEDPDVALGSGSANRLIEIERALTRLRGD